MKKKLIPLLLLITIILTSCTLFKKDSSAQPLSDAEMATRVAELLTTMTTPTSQIILPVASTPTQSLPTAEPTSTKQQLQVIVTLAPTTELQAETSQAQQTVSVESQNTPQPTPSATYPASDPVNSLGAPTSVDEMSSAEAWNWPTGSDEFIGIEFADGHMLMTNLSTKAAGWRIPLVTQQKDSYIELTVNSASCVEKDSYGIIFRVPVFLEPDQGYLYQVTCDGYYRLWKWDGKSGKNGLAVSLIPWKQSDKINVGQNQVNRLGVMVLGDTIKLFINGEALGSVSDSSYKEGFFGAFVRSGGSTNYTVKIDSMRYWQNPGQ